MELLHNFLETFPLLEIVSHTGCLVMLQIGALFFHCACWHICMLLLRRLLIPSTTKQTTRPRHLNPFGSNTPRFFSHSFFCTQFLISIVPPHQGDKKTFILRFLPTLFFHRRFRLGSDVPKLNFRVRFRVLPRDPKGSTLVRIHRTALDASLANRARAFERCSRLVDASARFPATFNLPSPLAAALVKGESLGRPFLGCPRVSTSVQRGVPKFFSPHPFFQDCRFAPP